MTEGDRIIEIPAFERTEKPEIERLLKQKGVNYRFLFVGGWLGLQSPWPGRYYVLQVQKKNLDVVAEFLTKYLGIQEPSLYTGQCPSCGYQVKNSFVCNDCGLSLMDDAILGLGNDPVAEFLCKNGFLSDINRRTFETISARDKEREEKYLKKSDALFYKMLRYFIKITIAAFLIVCLWEFIKSRISP